MQYIALRDVSNHQMTKAADNFLQFHLHSFAVDERVDARPCGNILHDELQGHEHEEVLLDEGVGQANLQRFF